MTGQVIPLLYLKHVATGYGLAGRSIFVTDIHFVIRQTRMLYVVLDKPNTTEHTTLLGSP